MTPREPDRFNVDSLMRRGLSKDAAIGLSREIAAALRAEHASALERAAQIVDTVNWPAKPLISARIRALIPPAAAPAAGRPFDPSAAPRKYTGPGYEFTVSDGGPIPAPAAEESAQECRQCAGTGCAPNHLSDTCGACGGTGMRGTDESDDESSEPVAPAADPMRILLPGLHRGAAPAAETGKAQGAEALQVQTERDIHFARERAERVEARIAELEGALRHAWGHARNAGCSGYLGQDFFARIEKVLAARAAPPEGEGK